MNRIQKTLGIGALILALASCSKPIISGRIVDKTYEPQKEYVRKVFFPIGKTFMPYDYTFIDDEDYKINFGVYVDEEFRVRTVYVTKEVFDSFSLGEQFDTSQIPHEDSDPDYAKKPIDAMK